VPLFGEVEALTARTALVVRAEFAREGPLLPGLAGGVIRVPEATRIGLALLRDLIEKAHRCEGMEPLVCYFPPDRRGEVEGAIGGLPVWSEPLAGPNPSERAAGLLRHLLDERAYRAAVMIGPGMAHVPRQRLLDAVHRLSTASDVVLADSNKDPLVFVGVRGQLSPMLFEDGLTIDERTEGVRVGQLSLPRPIVTQADLATAVFDLHAELATRHISHDDVPAHTLELLAALGLHAAMGEGQAPVLRRSRDSRRSSS